MKGKLIISGVLASSLLGGSVYSMPANAAEVQKKQNTGIDYKGIGQQGAIQDIDRKIDNMLASIPGTIESEGWKRFGQGEVKISGVNIEENNVTQIVPVFFGSNTFENTTDRDQTYNTSVFTEEITKTTTTQIENGFKTELAVEGKVGIPFIAEGKITTTLGYNFTHTSANTESVTNTISAPSQPTVVKPHTITRVDVYFEKKSTSGNVKLYADVNQMIISGRNLDSIGNGIDRAIDTQGLIRSPFNPDMVRVKGTGNFITEHGTNFIVKTYDITAGEQSAKLIDMKRIPLK